MNLSIEIPDTFLMFDDTVTKDILKQGASLLKKSTEDVLRSDGRVDTGQLVNSISTSVTGRTAYVYFKGKRTNSGKRKNGNSDRTIENNDIAFWLEYGNTSHPAHPFCDRAIKQAERSILSYAENTIDKALKLE